MYLFSQKKHLKQLRQYDPLLSRQVGRYLECDVDQIAAAFLYLQSLLKLEPTLIVFQSEADKMLLHLVYENYLPAISGQESLHRPSNGLYRFYDQIETFVHRGKDYETRRDLFKHKLINSVQKLYDASSDQYVYLLQRIFREMVLDSQYPFDPACHLFLSEVFSILWYYLHIAMEER